MILIIDGCDKAGKTTLIEKLKNKIPHLLLLKILDKPQDGSEFEKQKIKDHFEHMFEIAKENPYFIYVMDRWFTSEMVYSFKRGYEAMEDQWYLDFEKKIASFPSLFVLVNTPHAELKERFVKDKEDYAKIEEIEMIVDRYDTIYENTPMKKLLISGSSFAHQEGEVRAVVSAVKSIVDPLKED